MIDLQQNIVHRKSRPDAMHGSEWVLVYLPHNKHHPFVVATMTPDTARHNEWVHGTYHENYVGAKHDFDAREGSMPVGMTPWDHFEISQPGTAAEMIAVAIEGFSQPDTARRFHVSHMRTRNVDELRALIEAHIMRRVARSSKQEFLARVEWVMKAQEGDKQ